MNAIDYDLILIIEKYVGLFVNAITPFIFHKFSLKKCNFFFQISKPTFSNYAWTQVSTCRNSEIIFMFSRPTKKILLSLDIRISFDP